MTLALLIMAVGGAWAQSSLNVVELKAPAEWETDESNLTPADLPGFYTSTFDKAKAWTGAPTDGAAMLIYAFEGDDAHYVYFDKGTPEDKDYKFTFTKASVLFMTKIYYTVEPADPTEWLLTPDADKKVWTLDKMPASNVELQVEYEPTKVTMAANDNAMGTVEVAAGSKVEWTADTWKGWNYDTKEYTVGDITMTSSPTAYIRDYPYEGQYKHSLDFFVDKTENSSTVTFSTTGAPFSRIEFTMIDDYSESDPMPNPNIKPLDNWTFEGKSAVWEGEATKSLTLQSCTTFVSKITFYKGGDIPDGVTVNGDGTFTVAKTATVTLKATPKEGYKFLYWEDDNNNTNPVREVTIESGMADKTYKAVFAEITYNVTFVEGTNLNEWSATPDTEVKKDTKVDIKYSGAKKVIGVKVEKKGVARPLAEAVAADLGKIAGADGNIYDTKADAEAANTTAVAMIAYVGSSTDHATYKHGLAIALSDDNSGSNWSTAMSTIEGKSAVTNAAWQLPSQNQWKAMFKAFGDNEASYSGLNSAITTAEGTALQEGAYYWSSSEYDADNAWNVHPLDGSTNLYYYSKDYDFFKGRACLAF